MLAVGAALALPRPAHAQGLPEPPSRQDLAVGREAPRGDRSTLTVEGDVERGPCPLADPAFAETRVTFAAVEFAGLPGIPSQALESAWREFAGREQPIAALCEVRDRAASILRGMGYLAAVQVPPQRIEAEGTVRMDVLAAKLVEVQLRGDAGHSERLIAAHLEPLTTREWFNAREAERHLLLLEDLPGFDVRLVLRSAGSAPGEVVGDVVIVRRAVEAVVGAQNFGAPESGREGAFAAVTFNDLTGLGDRTSLTAYATFQWDEQKIVTLAHDFALNADGLRLGGSVLLGRSKPDLGGAPFRTDSFTAEGHLSYPLLRRQDHSLFFSGGLEVVDQGLSFGDTLLSDDQLRVLFLHFDHEMVDRDSIRGHDGFSVREPRWRSALSVELRQGLSGLGASDDCHPLADCLPPNVPISNFAADPSAFVARLEGMLEARPVPLVTVAVRPLAQISDAPLLSYEQASLGNYTVGRGFEPGIALGDSALGAAFELRYGTLYPRSTRAVALEPFAFLDVARTWVHDESLVPDPRRVLSAGAGLRGRWGDKVDFCVLVAVPLEPAGFQTETPDPRVLFTVTTRLLPWGDR
jgi:hemolysin activation/secretion protein